MARFARHITLTLVLLAWPAVTAAQGQRNREPVLLHLPEQEMAIDESELLPSRQPLREIEINEQIREHVDQLDAEAWPDREAATRALIDSPLADSQMYAAMEQLELSAEQRQRLMNVLHERIANAPRGALGIRMDVAARFANAPRANRLQAVTVIDLIAGMPAEQVLRVQDRITHIDDVPIASPDDLIVHIQGRRPGEQVELTVLRPRRDDRGAVVLDDAEQPITDTLELSIELGSVESLRDPVTGATVPANRLTLQRRAELRAAESRYGLPVNRIDLTDIGE